MAVVCAACASGMDLRAMPDVGTPDPPGDAGPGPGADAGVPPADGGSTGDPDAAVDDAGNPGTDAAPPDPGPAPIEALDRVALAIIVGDSIAAGYDAHGRNDPGGHGFARLVVDNHPDYPEWSGEHLSALFPGVEFRRVAESGATSGDALDNLRGALGSGLPRTVDGDVVVMIHVGGNDFNDSVLTIISATETARVAAQVQSNLQEMMRLLRERYADEAAGKRVVFLVDNIHDPTDGLGTIPAGFDEGFCGTLADPRLIAPLRMAGLMNLATMNAAIAATAEAAPDAVLVDFHDGFLGHGMNGGADRWISDDCAHPTDRGHSELRGLAWQALTGSRP